MASTPDLADVDALYGKRAMTDSAAQELIQMAVRLADTVYSGRIRATGEVEGDRSDFVALLAAHLWSLREGEPQSESQTGGSVSYNVLSGDVDDSLSETRYGRMAKAYVRDGSSLGVEKT